MKTTLTVVFVITSLFVAHTALGQTKPTAPTMKVVIGNATANDTQAGANDKFAELLTKYSNGRLQATAFHGGSLGGNGPMLTALQAGSVQGMILPAGFVSSVVPEISMFDLPFLLPGTPIAITAFAAQSKAVAKMMELAEQKNIHIIGFYGIGPSSILTKFPMNRAADLRGKKIRIIPSPPRVGSYQDWGAVPRPMELGEVYTALQQGVLDGLENAPDLISKMKTYEVARYYTITDHIGYAANIIVSKKWFDGLTEDLQWVVTKAGKETIGWASAAYTKSQNDGLEVLKKAITVTSMPAVEIEKMKDLVHKGIWEKMANDPLKGPIVKLLKEDVARFNRK